MNRRNFFSRCIAGALALCGLGAQKPRTHLCKWRGRLFGVPADPPRVIFFSHVSCPWDFDMDEPVFDFKAAGRAYLEQLDRELAAALSSEKNGRNPST